MCYGILLAVIMFLVIEVCLLKGIMCLKLPNIASITENNGIMVMGIPPSSPAEKTPDEKLIINKWWPNKSAAWPEQKLQS